jgi:hypothetical protein
VRGRVAWSRRTVLLWALAAPVAACTSAPPPPPPPDPLAELAARARADAVMASAVSGLADVARVRTEHAEALQREVDRERPPSGSSTPAPPSSTTAPVDPAAAKTALVAGLTATEQRIAELIGTVPRYRAGLLGSVAAGCASLREVLA